MKFICPTDSDPIVDLFVCLRHRIEIQKSLIEQGNFYSWSIQLVFFHLIWFLYIIRIYDCKYSQGSVMTFYHRAELRLTDTSVFAILGPHFPLDSDVLRIKLMEQEVIPFQVAKGMVVVGSFIAQEEDDLYVWIRRFESEEERERLYQAVYDSDHWKNEISPHIGTMLDRETIQVTRLEATPKSVIQ